MQHNVNRFQVPVRVYGDDIGWDANADLSALLRYMDRGRVEAIEAICAAAGHPSWLKEYTVNVYRIELELVSKAEFAIHLEVQTGIRKTSSHRATFDQTVVNPSTGEHISNGTVEVLFLENGKLKPVPAIIPDADDSAGAPKRGGPAPIPFNQSEHFKFQWPISVYYEDTDTQGITYHVSYLRFAERSLVELLHSFWPTDRERLVSSLSGLEMKRFEIRYLNATELGDRIAVQVGGREITDRSIVLDQRLWSQKNDKIAADMLTEFSFDPATDRGLDLKKQFSNFFL